MQTRYNTLKNQTETVSDTLENQTETVSDLPCIMVLTGVIFFFSKSRCVSAQTFTDNL